MAANQFPFAVTCQLGTRLTMDVRTFCLGILTNGEATGYEIKKLFEGPLSHFFDASFGSIYPALNRLTDEGLVSCAAMSQAKRPDKKVYSITPSGRLAFLDSLQVPPGPDRVRSDFLAIMLYSELLPARHLATTIDDRIADFEARIADLETCDSKSGSVSNAFVCGYGLAIYRASLEYLHENRHLVEGGAILSTPRAAE